MTTETTTTNVAKKSAKAKKSTKSKTGVKKASVAKKTGGVDGHATTLRKSFPAGKEFSLADVRDTCKTAHGSQIIKGLVTSKLAKKLGRNQYTLLSAK